MVRRGGRSGLAVSGRVQAVTDMLEACSGRLVAGPARHPACNGCTVHGQKLWRYVGDIGDQSLSGSLACLRIVMCPETAGTPESPV